MTNPIAIPSAFLWEKYIVSINTIVLSNVKIAEQL